MTSQWLHTCAKQLPINECVSNVDAIDAETNENSADYIECKGEPHEDSISYFMDNEEHLGDDQKM